MLNLQLTHERYRLAKYMTILCLFAVLVMMLMVLKRRIIVVGRHRRISWRCPPPAGSGGRSN